MFVQRRRRWANIKATLVRGLTFAGEFHRAAPDNAGKGLAADPGASPAGAGGVRAPHTAVIEGIESPRGLRGDLGGQGSAGMPTVQFTGRHPSCPAGQGVFHLGDRARAGVIPSQ